MSNGFHDAASSLVRDLDSMREILDPVMLVAHLVQKDAGEKHLAALEQSGKLISESEEEKSFEVPADHLSRIRGVSRKHERAQTAIAVLPRNFLVSFVSSYDAFLGRLLVALFETHPEMLDKSERQLSYKQLLEFETIDAARKRLLETEVESVLRESHAEQFRWLEARFKIKLREGLPSWKTFIELTERRNLFVHTHGKVSSQYLAVCTEHKCEIGETKLGDTLEASRKYLVEAYKCLYEVGVKLSQVLWRKMRPSDLTDADRALNDFAYDLLVDEKFDLATRLLEFAVNVLPKHCDDATKRRFIVNLAQAYKFSDREADCAALLDSMDWTSCSDDYTICLCVLRDRFDQAGEVMLRMGAAGPIQEKWYIEWPIFRRFRESAEFRDAFQRVFGHEPTGLLKHDSADSALEIAKQPG